LTDYLTEQEQVELLKSWVKQYSLVILVGILIAIVAVSSWRYWQQRHNNILMHASQIYDEMLTKRAQNDTNAILVQAKKLTSRYQKTPYGQLAALMLARDAVNQKDYKEVEQQLRWVLEHSSNSSIRQIARLRLARTLIVEQKAAIALKVLEKIEDNSFNGLIDEVKGDAYLSMHSPAMARQAYRQALAELPNAETNRPLLQMKYDNLASGNLLTA
jgi:predicted negative regulator of RcsB-dependent stress response